MQALRTFRGVISFVGFAEGCMYIRGNASSLYIHYENIFPVALSIQPRHGKYFIQKKINDYLHPFCY
jgi:hypothetical protein